MLVDTRKEQTTTGFAVNVDNTERKAHASIGQRLGWIIMVIFTLGILWIYSILWKNALIAEQMKINNSASNIEVNETKRRDTLIKLLEQTKGYMKHEKETFTLVAKYRSGTADKNDTQKLDNQLSQFMMNLNVQYEQYPQLKADALVAELMSTSQYLENELSAARRLYNQNASSFNAEIFMFPKIVLATKIGLEAMPLYQATAQQRQDVDMSSLSNYSDSPQPTVSNTNTTPNLVLPKTTVTTTTTTTTHTPNN